MRTYALIQENFSQLHMLNIASHSTIQINIKNMTTIGQWCPNTFSTCGKALPGNASKNNVSYRVVRLYMVLIVLPGLSSWQYYSLLMYVTDVFCVHNGAWYLVLGPMLLTQQYDITWYLVHTVCTWKFIQYVPGTSTCTTTGHEYDYQ